VHRRRPSTADAHGTRRVLVEKREAAQIIRGQGTGVHGHKVLVDVEKDARAVKGVGGVARRKGHDVG